MTLLVAPTLAHDLRHAVVPNLVRAGVGEKTAMTISGHRSAGIFKRYAIVSTEDTREALEKVRRLQLNGTGTGAGI